MPAFRRSFPLIFTSFINKTGTIGLSLVPMILVARQMPTTQAAQYMTLVKASTLAGTLLGGVSCDRLGLTHTLLASFLLAALGLGIIPFVNGLGLILLGACIAAAGQAMYPSAARLLITKLSPDGEQQESLGWLRTANNFGMIGSFGLGWLLQSFGVGLLMFIDSGTSVLAAVVGYLLLKPAVAHAGENTAAVTQAAKSDTARANGRRRNDNDWPLFVLTAVTVALESGFYELFMVGTSAKCRLVHGDAGLGLFSRVMLINTVLCAALGVPAARMLKNPGVALPWGAGLTALGVMIIFMNPSSEAYLYGGAFCLSMGEVAFMAMGTYALIQVTPSSKNRGSLFSTALLAQQGAKILGAAAAFPMLVHGDAPLPFLAILGSVLLGFAVFSGARLRVRLGL